VHAPVHEPFDDAELRRLGCEAQAVRGALAGDDQAADLVDVAGAADPARDAPGGVELRVRAR